MAPAHASQLQRATREEHMARMQQAERMLRVQGFTSTDVERKLAAEHGIHHRQARRYVTAVRSIYARAAEVNPLITREEWFGLVLADHAACVTSEKPDWRAAQKLLETIARANGWYAPRTVHHEHSGSVELFAGAKVAALSPEEQAALAAYHEARARREIAGELVASPVEVDAGAVGVAVHADPVTDE